MSPHALSRARGKRKVKGEPLEDNCPYKDIVAAFNSVVREKNVTWSPVKSKSSNRAELMRCRFRSEAKQNIDWFNQLFNKAADSNFLSGRSGQWKNCTFEWLLKPSNATKVMDGYYNDK